MSFARAESDVEVEYLVKVADKAIEYHQSSMKFLAAQIINYLGKSLKAD